MSIATRTAAVLTALGCSSASGQCRSDRAYGGVVEVPLWLAGLSVGGGIAIDDRRWELEDEARALKARLAELAD